MYKSLQYSVAALAVALLGVASLQAQDGAQKERLKRQSVEVNAQADPSGRMDAKTRGATVRVSQLIGMNIQNNQGESVGEINDIVLDEKSGKIRYVAVTYGGFLGLGDDLFAVPFEAFQYKRAAEDRDDFVLVLDVTEEQLDGAKGFDQDHWPNFADRNFVKELDQRYKVNRRPLRDRLRDGRVNVDVGNGRVDVDVDGE
ncbi:PRC-barrel domain protein [Roseimaritima multifibrata]|uniref:PRC-barrel domain protein n=1 Tax=Roseimaritima multifibrata TaxID=1930274 RepID=A0A517MLE9_9BACT|nr:PRC-barrel domain-containing protein [Roseimaritima multifibrata]QDS95703.1 PRC-barrel domain protein [Roseimaritima multifibrata]